MSNLTQEIDIGMVRVSSFKQGLAGDSPDEQKEAIQAKRTKEGRIDIPIEWVEIIESASGVKQPYQRVLAICKQSQIKISRVYAKVIDRMTRGGAKPYIFFKEQLEKNNVQLVDVAGVISSHTVNTLEHITNKKYAWSVYNPSYKEELLEAEAGKDEVRKILTRMIGAEIRYIKYGYWVGPSPLGYKNKKIDTAEHGERTILEPDIEKEAVWFETMFSLVAQGTPYLEVVKQVNAMGFKTRPRKIYDELIKTKVIGVHSGEILTVKSLKEYIKRPIYAGVNNHSWLEGKPVKGRFKSIISIDLFNRANKGKITIVEDGENVRIYNGKVPSYLQKKDKFNSYFPYKDQVLCPKCKKPFYASTSKGRNGHYPAYHHGSRTGTHPYLKVSRDTFHETIRKFVQEVKFTDDFLMYLHKFILEEWETRRKTSLDKNITLGQRLTSIEQEQKMYAEKIPLLSSAVAIKVMESKIEELEQAKVEVMAEKAKRQKEGMDIQKIIHDSWYFFEHLEDLLLEGTNTRTNSTLFGLLFDEKPTYEDLLFRTAKLSCVFKLSEAHKNTLGQKSMNSDPTRIRTEDQELKRLLLYR